MQNIDINTNPFNFFDAIFCINLDKRVDRWKKVVIQFQKLRIEERVERFSAIESIDGKVGITKSLGKVLKIAKDRCLNNVLIFEDDVSFLWENSPLDSLLNSLEQAKYQDWKLFCLGAHLIEPLPRISDNLVQFNSGYGNHAMAYHSSIFDQIIDHCENTNTVPDKNDIIDVWLSNNINKNYLCLLVYPLLAVQINGYSDIEKKNMSRSYFEPIYKKMIVDSRTEWSNEGINSMITNKIKPIALYFPQFHPISENDINHGKGWTDFTNLKGMKDTVFDETIKKPLLGFYNLLDKSVRKEHGRLARDHGIYGFCYYHYWFPKFDENDKIVGEPQTMHKVLDTILIDGEPDIPFMLNWVNESWTKKWDGLDKDITLKQTYGTEEEWDRHFDYLLPFFKHKNYIKKENKPILVIYHIFDIPEIDNMLKYWRRRATDSGFNGLFIVQSLELLKNGIFRHKLADAVYEGNPILSFKLSLKDKSDKPEYKPQFIKVKYEKLVKSLTKLDQIDDNHYKGLHCGFNNTPRVYSKKKCQAIINTGFNSVIFSEFLDKQLKRSLDQNSKFIFINGWNEWGEGMCLEPDTGTELLLLRTVKNGLIHNAKKYLKTGLAISTWFSKDNKNRLEVFKKSITSLLNTNFDGPILLVDDCSETFDHIDFVERIDKQKRITIHLKKQRSGISKTKNTCIRLLLDEQTDILILADDDVFYLKNNWSDCFVETMLATGFPHLNIPQPEDPGTTVFVNNYPLLKFNKNPKGLIMTFTKQLIETTGYFNIFPKFYGWEHINYSNRCLKNKEIPFYAGIKDSNSVVTDCSKIMQVKDDLYKSIPKREQIKQARYNFKSLKMEDTFECVE